MILAPRVQYRTAKAIIIILLHYHYHYHIIILIILVRRGQYQTAKARQIFPTSSEPLQRTSNTSGFWDGIYDDDDDNQLWWSIQAGLGMKMLLKFEEFVILSVFDDDDDDDNKLWWSIQAGWRICHFVSIRGISFISKVVADGAGESDKSDAWFTFSLFLSLSFYTNNRRSYNVFEKYSVLLF